MVKIFNVNNVEKHNIIYEKKSNKKIHLHGFEKKRSSQLSGLTVFLMALYIYVFGSFVFVSIILFKCA